MNGERVHVRWGYRDPQPPPTGPHHRLPSLLCFAHTDLPFGNPLFGRSLMSPGSGDGPSLNPVFSPATAGGGAPTAPPSSAVGLLRLGFMPRPALQPSPGSPDDPMEAMEAEGSGLPPGGSLAVAGASPGGGAALAGFGGRERPEEDEFATVLSAGEREGGGCAGKLGKGCIMAALRHAPAAQAAHPVPPRRALQSFPFLDAAVMRGEAGAAEAVREYAAVCRQRAAALKELASSQLQRAARCVGAGSATARVCRERCMQDFDRRS